MKKLFLIALVAFSGLFTFAQDNPSTETKKKKKDWSKVSLAGRANDHFLIQLGVTNWAQKPDSINTGGISKSFNFYIMLDFPFKTDPRFSVAFGPGIGTDNISFEKTNIILNDHTKSLRFEDVSDTNHFEKYKLASAFLELPIELRFSSNPEKSGKSFKIALGAKVGTSVNVHTKGKNWVTKAGAPVTGFDDKYVEKKRDKYFFNGNRLVGTARIGYGLISLFGTYQLGSFVRDGFGPQVKPYTIGLTISGL